MSGIPFDPHGILLRRTAVALGLDDNWLNRMVRSGQLARIRHGAYADAETWRGLSPAQRQVLLGRAVMQQYDDRVALSHASAHVRRGGPDHGLDLGQVHVTNLFGRGDRVQAGITHHHGEVRVTDITRLDDHWITSPARTAVETAADADLVPAVCVLDWTLNQKLATREQFVHYAEAHMRAWPDSIGLPIAVRRCDGRSESVGESWSRLLLEDHGFHPEPQVEFHHPSGHLAGIVDLVLLEQGIMVEFDGKVKYGRLLKPGQTINDVILAERAREKLLQELTGLWMFRLGWADLHHPVRTVDRLNHVIAQRAAARSSSPTKPRNST